MSKDIYRLRRFACSRWNLTWVKSQYDGADLRHDYHQCIRAKKYIKSNNFKYNLFKIENN